MVIDTSKKDKNSFVLENYMDYEEVTTKVFPYLKYQFIIADFYTIDIYLKEGETIQRTGTTLDGLKIGDTLYKTYFRSNGPIIYFNEKSLPLKINEGRISLKVDMKKQKLTIDDLYLEFINESNKKESVWVYTEFNPFSIMTKGYFDKNCLFSISKQETDEYYNSLVKRYNKKLPSLLNNLVRLPKPEMHFKYYAGGEGQFGNIKYYEALVHRTNGMFADVEVCMQMNNPDNHFVKINEKYKKRSSTYFPKTYKMDEVPEEYQWVVDKIKEKFWNVLLEKCNPKNFEKEKYCSICDKEIHGTVQIHSYGAVICEDCRPYAVFYIGNNEKEYEHENKIAKYTKDITPFQGKCACGCGKNLLEGFKLDDKYSPSPSYAEFLGKKYSRNCIDKVVEKKYNEIMENKLINQESRSI